MYLRNVILAALVIATVAFAQSIPPLAALDTPYQVRYAVNLTTESGGAPALALDAYFNVANDGANGASAFGSGLGNGSTGNICANLYVFDNQEELLWCCSCIITPDETIGFSLQKDILSNPLTTIATGSVTVKLVGTAAGTGTGGCFQSAALQGTPTLVPGLLAWGTTPHLINQAAGQTTYFETETPFLPAQLSAGEETSLATKCAGILGNGTGYGTCKSCETNALGGQKM